MLSKAIEWGRIAAMRVNPIIRRGPVRVNLVAVTRAENYFRVPAALHSYRNAVTGSIRVARHAGTKAARTQAQNTQTSGAAMLKMLDGSTSYSKVIMNREVLTPPKRPNTRPSKVTKPI